MIVELNHMLYIEVMFAVMVIKGLLAILIGMAGVKKETYSHYGGIDILSGLIALVIAVVVVIL